jgi:hypothetical protein
MLLARTAGFVLAAMTVSSVAASANPWDNFSGLLDGGYAYSRIPLKQAVDSDQYTVQGSLLYTIDSPGLNVQIDGGSNFYFAVPHSDAHLWNAGGSLFWRDNKGTFGVSGSYFSVDAQALPLFLEKKSIASFGLFGEYYAFQNLSFQIRGGGTTGPIGSSSGYGGGGLTFYESPDFALHAEANFTSFTSGHDWTNVRAEIEYLPFNYVPVGLYAGYDHTTVSAGNHASTLFAGLKVHFGQGRVLSTYNRTGPAEWTGIGSPGANVRF